MDSAWDAFLGCGCLIAVYASSSLAELDTLSNLVVLERKVFIAVLDLSLEISVCCHCAICTGTKLFLCCSSSAAQVHQA